MLRLRLLPDITFWTVYAFLWGMWCLSIYLINAAPFSLNAPVVLSLALLIISSVSLIMFHLEEY